MLTPKYAQGPDDPRDSEEPDFWSFFPGLPRKAVIAALQIVEDNEWESSMSRIREVADREATDEARPAHERHVNLVAHCYLCRKEAGPQLDRLQAEDDDPYEVWVDAVNDAGEHRKVWGSGMDVDEAVHDAVHKAIHETDDDTFTMNDWGAA
jgi:hypothetical protein